MIVKRIPIRNLKKSSFSRLTQYITNSQGKNERVGEIRITNCGGDTPEVAAKEIELVQGKNKRSRMDRTYHLLVSFRESDQPSDKLIKEIEGRLCETIGYAEHQRISAVHHDTDHTHLHIAINKIHPIKLTAHEPYYDKRKLGNLAEILEVEYNLKKDNHKPRMTPGEAKAQDMEKAAGIESLIGWVKRGCLPDLLKASSWQELHATLAKNGLQVQPRGNGLIITDGKGNIAKASSIDRQLSKHALEGKLGNYRTSNLRQIKPTNHYQLKPMPSKIDTKQLWEEYQKEQTQLKHKQVNELKGLLERKKRMLAAAKGAGRTKRAGIKLVKSMTAKKILYNSVSKSLLKDITKINQDYEKERRKLYDKGSYLAWHDWLKKKAQDGNHEALVVLRSRYERELKHGNIITNATPNNDNSKDFKGAKIDNVTKKGTVHYQIASSVLRDDGKKFWLSNDLAEKTLKSALQLAIKRFGRRLDIQGTNDFRAAIIKIATENALSISFADPEMETSRQSLIKKEAEHYRNQHMHMHAKKYISERNDKHKNGLDVLHHRHYKSTDAGKLLYAGVRKMENTNLVLLKTSSEILVMPIDEKTAYRVKRMSVGSTIEITTGGNIKTHVQIQSKGR